MVPNDQATMHYTKHTFTNATEILDGNSYENCEFQNCRLVYGGGELPSIVGCQFMNNVLVFDAAADRTLQFMRAIYHGFGPGGREIVETAFASIRGRARS